jgi:hypothetical protein
MRCVITQKYAAVHYLSNQFVKYPFLLEMNEGKNLVRNTKSKTLKSLYSCSHSVCPIPCMLSVIVYLNLYYLNLPDSKLHDHLLFAILIIPCSHSRLV